jgi:hypothetical protein
LQDSYLNVGVAALAATHGHGDHPAHAALVDGLEGVVRDQALLQVGRLHE